MANPQQLLDIARAADAAGNVEDATRAMQLYADATRNRTSVSATPTGPMAAIRQFRADVAGNTAERARPYLEASQATQAKYLKPGLAGALELYNPLNMASNVGNALGAILAPVGGVGDTIGTRIDPVFGKPGSGGGEQRKYGDVLQLATPLPGGAAVRGGKAVMGAVDLAAALAAAKKAPGAVGGAIAAPFKAGGRILDAGATPAVEAVRAAAIAKALAQNKRVDSLTAEVAEKKAADKPLRKIMEDVAKAKADQGIGVSDVFEARNLVAELNGRLNPSGPVATTPTTGQASAYKAIIETLAPSKGPKPSLEMVQNLRRELADAAYGGTDLRGFGAINKIDKRNLVDRLYEIEKSYTEGASELVRANWSSIPDQKALKKAQKQAVVFKAQASILDELPPAKAVEKAQSIVDSYFKRGLIPQTEYQEYMKLANAATDAKGKSVFRKRLATALAVLGATQTPLGPAVLRATVGVP